MFPRMTTCEGDFCLAAASNGGLADQLPCLLSKGHAALADWTLLDAFTRNASGMADTGKV